MNFLKKFLSAVVLFCLVNELRACDTSVTGPSTACPYFSCNSTVGVQGQIDSTITPPLASFFLDIGGNQIQQDSQCTFYCNHFFPACQYWTRVNYDGTTGGCFLFPPTACNSPSSFLPNSTACLPLNSNPSTTVAGSFTSGSYCKSQPPAPPPPTASVTGDPHYTGADNSHFDFTGEPGRSYCMLSDSHVHVNVFHGGRYGVWGQNRNKSLTWIRQIVVFWGHHQFKFVARSGADWQYNNGYMGRMEFNNREIHLTKPGTSASLERGQAVISWLSSRLRSGDDEIDVYELHIVGVIRLVMKLRPEVGILRTPEDGTVHFGIELPSVNLTANVHGIIGQTFRADHANRLSSQALVHDQHLNVDQVPGDNAEGFLDGSVADYESSSVSSPDCGVTRFARAVAPDPETALAIELSSAAVVQRSFKDLA